MDDYDDDDILAFSRSVVSNTSPKSPTTLSATATTSSPVVNDDDDDDSDGDGRRRCEASTNALYQLTGNKILDAGKSEVLGGLQSIVSGQ